MKSLICFVIDALSTEVVDRALAEGRLPNLASLVERGQRRDSRAVFPSITPAATASLLTGDPPAVHGIAGAHWIDENEECVAYYGDDLWAILEEGLDTFLNDFLVTLNYQRLRVPGLFHELDDAGRSTACINYLWFRGAHRHHVVEPWLLKLVPGVSLESEIEGPRWLQLGDFVSGMPEGVTPTAGGGIMNRLGFNDERTMDTLLQLHEVGLPDFTLAYLPNNDFESHERGPSEAVDVLERFDERLGELFDHAGGVDAFLDRTMVVLTGDHAQSELVEDAEERGIELDDVLAEFKIGRAGAYWSETDDLVVCPNLRAAQVYCREPGSLDAVVARLLGDSRVDQVFLPPGARDGWFEVSTADRGRFRFRESERDDAVRDEFGNRWEWEGDATAVDATFSNGTVDFGDYPNALERIAGGFGPCTAPILATARVGYEFRVHGTSIHAAGSHGSLHRRDSISPLVVAGCDELELPTAMRAIDVAPLCKRLLGVD